MFDDQGPAGVRSRLVRRDGSANADYGEVIFDTYHDHIGRLFFMVNPSGVRNDANGLGGGDDSWDPVWVPRAIAEHFPDQGQLLVGDIDVAHTSRWAAAAIHCGESRVRNRRP